MCFNFSVNIGIGQPLRRVARLLTMSEFCNRVTDIAVSVLNQSHTDAFKRAHSRASSNISLSTLTDVKLAFVLLASCVYCAYPCALPWLERLLQVF